MVRTLVRNYLVRRGDTYYFRYTLSDHIQDLCSALPTEIKRSLRTGSYSAALALVCEKLPLIQLIRNCKHKPSIEKLFNDIADFSLNSAVTPDSNEAEHKPIEVLTLSEAWDGFVKWKSWTDKQGKANQRMFDNLLFFLGNIPFGQVTKTRIRMP